MPTCNASGSRSALTNESQAYDWRVIDPSGVYDASGLPILIEPFVEGWTLTFGGVPSGFEPTLVRVDDNRFRVVRGPFDGAVLEFVSHEEGLVGPMPVRRIDGPYEEPPGYGLLEPPKHADPERDKAFDELLKAAPPGGRLEWSLPYPKHEFIRWAGQKDMFLFHGSTDPGIIVFQPIRESFELSDHSGRGNLGAVYATHNGYWSMFFAVVARNRLKGSMRNGVFTWESANGQTATTYQFSLEKDSLESRPFTNGVIYLLPKETFRRLALYEGGPLSDEWASEQPIRPVASLAIEPDDFPFLDRIAGHDETEFLEMLRLFNVILAAAESSTRRSDETLTVDIAWSEELDDTYRSWRVLADDYLASVTVTLDGYDNRRQLGLEGPSAYIGLVAERLEELRP